MLSLKSNNFEVNDAGFIALDDYVMDTNDEDTHNMVKLLTKCGEIFMEKTSEDLELSFKCLYCHKVCNEVKEFTQHLLHVHLSVEVIYENNETQLVPAADEDETNETDEEIILTIETVPPENILEQEVITNDSDSELPNIQELPFKCDECPKSFKTKYNLETHVYTHSRDKPYKCNLCPRSFVNKQNLTIHLRRHNGEKPFECEQCFRSFASSTEKKIHLRSHTGEKSFICLECGKTHATSSQLLEHRRCVHLDERKFTCYDCMKSFYTKRHLQNHQEAIHSTGPRSFVCKICNLNIKTEFYLKAHMKIHMEEKSYKCSVCGKVFAQHSGLHQHKKSHERWGEINEE